MIKIIEYISLKNKIEKYIYKKKKFKKKKKMFDPEGNNIERFLKWNHGHIESLDKLYTRHFDPLMHAHQVVYVMQRCNASVVLTDVRAIILFSSIQKYII